MGKGHIYTHTNTHTYIHIFTHIWPLNIRKDTQFYSTMKCKLKLHRGAISHPSDWQKLNSIKSHSWLEKQTLGEMAIARDEAEKVLKEDHSVPEK